MYPFTNTLSDRVAHCGEVALIEDMKEWLGKANPPAPCGIGDDCAVFDFAGFSGKGLLTVDSLVYGRHFDATHAPLLAGGKLLRRNLSDIAAMGGLPVGAVVALVMGKDVSVTWLEQFYRGMAEVSLRYRCPIYGGDITESAEGTFSASLTLLGTAEKPVTRAGSAGDSLWVTGALGGSLVGRHLTFEPRLAEGLWLSRQKGISAMMDISDGLGKDLLCFLRGGLQAMLDVSSIPLHEDAVIRSRITGMSPLEHAFGDGEDYELLFAIKDTVDVENFRTAYQREFGKKPFCIGRLRALPSQDAPRIVSVEDGREILIGGFNHFKTEISCPSIG